MSDLKLSDQTPGDSRPDDLAAIDRWRGRTSQVGQALVLGIGSPHGDDQAGWLLIDRLATTAGINAGLRKASVPHQLIDWSDRCSELHIVDACGAGEEVLRMELGGVNSRTIAGLVSRCHSSHHFGIADALELARLLGKLPARVVFWAIPGVNVEPGQTVSPECLRHIDHCAERLAGELSDA